MSENEPRQTNATDSGPITYAEWRQALEDETLLGLNCSDCEWRTATPKRICSDCGSTDLKTVELPKRGELYSETTINVPPEDFEGSYQVGIVSLGDTKIMARIETDADIGDEVTFTGHLHEGEHPAPIFE